MTSQKQIDANRRNAQKSTGPTSDAGKAASSANAIKSGIYAKTAVMKGENPAELQALIDDYYSRHRPATSELRAILDDLINTEWALRRLIRVEAQMWNHQMENSWTAENDKYPAGKAATIHCKAFGYLQRRIDSTRRARDRALVLLREHRANPVPAPEPDAAPAPVPAPTPALTLCPPVACHPNGFVSAPLSQAPEPPVCRPETGPEVVLS